MSMKHTCVKPECANTYEDEDTDAYYCPSCLTAKQAIAKEVDTKLASMPSQRQGLSFNERMAQLPKIPGTNIPMIR